MAEIPPGERERLVDLVIATAGPKGLSDDERYVLEVMKRKDRPLAAMEFVLPVWQLQGTAAKMKARGIVLEVMRKLEGIFKNTDLRNEQYRLRILIPDPASPLLMFHLVVTPQTILRELLCQSFLVTYKDLDRLELRVFELLRNHDEPISVLGVIGVRSRLDATIKGLEKRLQEHAKTSGDHALQIVASGQGLQLEYHLVFVRKNEFEEATRVSASKPRSIPVTLPPSAMIFLCHSSADKERVRQLNMDLTKEGFNTWLDEDNLLPGQIWEFEIKKAVRASDIVLVCLSKTSITQEGFVNKEIKIALDVADHKPEGTIFLIPARLEECVIPDRLSHIHWVDLFRPNGFQKLVQAIRRDSLR